MLISVLVLVTTFLSERTLQDANLCRGQDHDDKTNPSVSVLFMIFECVRSWQNTSGRQLMTVYVGSSWRDQDHGERTNPFPYYLLFSSVSGSWRKEHFRPPKRIKIFERLRLRSISRTGIREVWSSVKYSVVCLVSYILTTDFYIYEIWFMCEQ